MNNIDKRYQELLQDILDNGVEKKDRTGTGTISVFGRQIRHKMSEGFPLLTTKKMPFKTIVTELLWFLRGDTNIKYLVDNNCHIWDGDAYKNYENKYYKGEAFGYKKLNNLEYSPDLKLSQEEFIEQIKTDDEFAEKWGELGPIYGKQWRSWREGKYTNEWVVDGLEIPDGPTYWKEGIDQITSLIYDLKTNPDSRRLMVNAWNVGEIDQMVLPPCHYGFQVYTRELSMSEKELWYKNNNINPNEPWYPNVPTRAISLMWNQRSVDTFLGLPFNIASYGLLLEIIAKEVNMVPEELIGSLGDVHLYSNHIEQAKEQIGRELTLDERKQIAENEGWYEKDNFLESLKNTSDDIAFVFNFFEIQKRTREPFPLPKINFNSEWWDKPFFELIMNDNFCKCLLEEDIQLFDYESHPSIKAPLSN